MCCWTGNRRRRALPLGCRGTDEAASRGPCRAAPPVRRAGGTRARAIDLPRAPGREGPRERGSTVAICAVRGASGRRGCEAGRARRPTAVRCAIQGGRRRVWARCRTREGFARRGLASNLAAISARRSGEAGEAWRATTLAGEGPTRAGSVIVRRGAGAARLSGDSLRAGSWDHVRGCRECRPLGPPRHVRAAKCG